MRKHPPFFPWTGVSHIYEKVAYGAARDFELSINLQLVTRNLQPSTYC